MRPKPTPVLAIVALAALSAWPGASRATAAAAADSVATPPASSASKPAATPTRPAAKSTAVPDTLDLPWRPGRSWMSFRIGYAKSTVDNGGNGSIGGGFGYSRMLGGLKLWRFRLLRRYSLGAYVHFDQLARFGDAVELEVPATLELVRHYRLGSPYLRPYLGIGGGGYWRGVYRTGYDIGHMRVGGYVVFGANSPIDAHHVLGLDARVARVERIDKENIAVNPVFVDVEESATHWSLKLNYALTY